LLVITCGSDLFASEVVDLTKAWLFAVASRRFVSIAIFRSQIAHQLVSIAIFRCQIAGQLVSIAIFRSQISGQLVSIAIF